MVLPSAPPLDIEEEDLSELPRYEDIVFHSSSPHQTPEPPDCAADHSSITSSSHSQSQSASIPNDIRIYSNHPSIPEDPSSSASFIKDDSGNIFTYDLILQNDPEEVFNFMLTQLQSCPSLQIVIDGYHYETKYRTVKKKDVNGDETSTLESYQQYVQDLLFNLDVTHLMEPKWEFITAENYQQLPVREVIMKFCESNGFMKELTLEKKVLWFYNDVEAAIRRQVRASGFTESLNVSFVRSSNKVKVRPSSGLAQNIFKISRFLSCFLDCIRICQKTSSSLEQQLDAYYDIDVSAEDFMEEVNNTIYLASCRRVKGETYDVNMGNS